MEATSQQAATAATNPARANVVDPTAPVAAGRLPRPSSPSRADVSTMISLQRSDTSVREGAEPSGNLEEYFSGTVEIVASDGMQVRVVTSGGEQATAWLPLANVPASERRHVRPGAPVRVAIVTVERGGTIRREHRVRFPRHAPLPDEAQAHVAEWLVTRMQNLLLDRSQG